MILPQQILPAYQIAYYLFKIIGIYAFLLHGIPVTDGYCIILQRLMIYSNTKWRTNCVLAAVAFANGILFFILQIKIHFQTVHYFTCFFGKAIFLYQRENS